RRRACLEKLPPCSLPGSRSDIVNQQVQKKRVQVTPDGAETLIEDRQELDDILDLRGGELPVAGQVGLLVLLAEYLQLGEGFRGFVVVRAHAFEARQPAELEQETAGQLCCLRLAG